MRKTTYASGPATRLTTASRATPSPQPTSAVRPAFRDARLDDLVAVALTERDGHLASIRCCAAAPSTRVSRPTGRHVGPLASHHTSPAGHDHNALLTASESVLGEDNSLAASARDVLAAATDVENHGTLPCRVVTDRPGRTPTPADRVSEAVELESSPTPDLNVGAFRQVLAPSSRSQADLRDPATPQRSACPDRTLVAPNAAAPRRRPGACPTEPRARGSPTPREPP